MMVMSFCQKENSSRHWENALKQGKYRKKLRRISVFWLLKMTPPDETEIVSGSSQTACEASSQQAVTTALYHWCFGIVSVCLSVNHSFNTNVCCTYNHSIRDRKLQPPCTSSQICLERAASTECLRLLCEQQQRGSSRFWGSTSTMKETQWTVADEKN